MFSDWIANKLLHHFEALGYFCNFMVFYNVLDKYILTSISNSDREIPTLG